MQSNCNVMIVPDHLELLSFFESEPVEHVPSDGYWCYEFTGLNDITLRLSCNVIERSVQTVLIVAGRPISTVVHESAEQITIEDKQLVCHFASGFQTLWTIVTRPVIQVNWSSLEQ